MPGRVKNMQALLARHFPASLNFLGPLTASLEKKDNNKNNLLYLGVLAWRRECSRREELRRRENI